MRDAPDPERRLSGSVQAFDANWKSQQATSSYHFKRGVPQNQMQFAFQGHWRIFLQILSESAAGRTLEVGSGRGSMSAYFADDGYDTHLLDSSRNVLAIARANFAADVLSGSFLCGDALSLPYSSEAFEVVLSIGLLEHFADIEPPVREQLRILRKGGIFLGYVVPRRRLSVQTLALPINAVLRFADRVDRSISARGHTTRGHFDKVPLYRNGYRADTYLAALHRLGVERVGSMGLFPVPMISHSPSFPFTPMAPRLERRLVGLWQRLLHVNTGHNDTWICPEWWGLAFLVWAQK